MLDPRLWRDDHSTAQCTACATAFSLFRCRRHHCRHCGSVFCDACTGKRLWLRPWTPEGAAWPTPSAADTTQRGASLPATAAPSPVALPPSRALASSSVSESSVPASTPRSASEGSNGDGASLRPGAAATPASAAATPPGDATPRELAAGQRRRCLSAAATAASSGSNRTTTTHTTPSPNASNGASAAACAGRVPQHHRCSTSGGLTTSSAETEAPAPLPLASFPATMQDAPLACAIEGANNATAPVGAAVKQAPSGTVCGMPHARVDGLSGLGVTAHHSRRVSSSIFSGSLYAVSPSSTTGDRLSQAWASPDVLLGPEQGGSSSRLLPAGSGVAVGAAAAGQSSVCVSSTSDMNLLPRGASAHVDPLDAQTRAPSPRKDAAASRALAATGSLALMARRAAAARLQASDPRGDASPSSAAETEELYRRESYGVDVDAARCITWYLCRVCRSCYDHFLDVILDAHETPTAASGAAAAVAALEATAAAAALQSSAGLPLWYYVRLCASATGSPHPTTQRHSAENSVISASASPTSASTPLWSSAWARLRTSMSLSHAASSPASRAPSITASPVSANMAAVALPSLQPRDLCCTQDGSGHLSPSTLGPKRTDDSVLSFSATSPISSPRHQTTPRTAAAQPQKQPQQQQVTSPPAPFPVRAQRPVSPPRRRLISIDGSGPGPTRQAVALARRRRRIAVVLIDERDVAPAALGESAARAPASLRFPSAPPVQPAAEVSPLDKQLPVPRPPATRRADRCSPASTPGGGEAEVDVLKPLVAREGGGRVAPQAAMPSATHSAVHRPKLSILVDSDDNVVEEANTAAGGSGAGGGGSGGVRPVSTSASVFGGDGAGALHGLSPAVWLAPYLPAEASAWLVHEDAGAAARAALLRGSPSANAYNRTSPEASPSSSFVSNTPATSRPISCAPGGPAGARGAPAATAASGAAGASGASGGHAEGKRPAVPLAAESATCVLQALFAQIGAAVHLSATPATTASTSPTPASAAAAAAAAVMSGGAFGGASSEPRWGTGPQSYAAQRQALVRDMLARYQQQSAVAAGLTSPFALSSPASGFYANSGGSDASRDGSGSGGCVFAAAAATPRASGATGLSGAGAACTAAGAAGAAFERVMASVTTYFQIRPPPSVVRMPAEPTVLTILPVATQVELVGIPIDTSATCAAAATVAPQNAFASPRGRPSGTAPSATANGPASVSGITGAAARPFTLAEFLSQLAKLSTNLDGYVVIVLRRHAQSRGDADAVTTPSAGSGGGTPQLTSGTTGGAGCGSTFTSFALTDEANPSRESSPSSAQPRQSRRRGRRGRHQHRVSVLFDGSHFRQLYQQLHNCGVAQPALSVVEVYDEEVRLPAALEQSPGSVASNRSPIDAVSLGEDKGSEGAPRSAQLKPRVPGADVERGTSAGVAEAALGQSRVSPQLVALSQSTRSVCSSSDSTTPRVRRSAEQTPLPPSTATGSGKLGDLLERLQLPSAVVASHGAAAAGRSVAPGSAAAATAAPAAPVSARAARAAPSAQDSATASLHAACRQLDVAMTTLAYATPSTVAPAVPFPSAPALSVTGGSATPARSASTDAPPAAAAALKSPSAVAGAGCGSAYLSRALESLVTTLVYRDLHGTLAP